MPTRKEIQDVSDTVAELNSEWEDTEYICPACGAKLQVSNIVITTYPVKYHYKCPKCTFDVYTSNNPSTAKDGKVPNQEAKKDYGKLRLTLVPYEGIKADAYVRMYGITKYSDPDNWRRVEVERYRDAAFRHFLAYLEDPYGNDEESGLPHLYHLHCNISFLCDLEKGKLKWDSNSMK